MSHMHNPNEEVPMERLFQEALEDHREAINEKDADQFLSQLEGTGFFNQGIPIWKKPFFLSSGFVVVVGAVVTILYFNNKNTADTKLPNPAKNIKTNITSSDQTIEHNNAIDNHVSEGLGKHKINKSNLNILQSTSSTTSVGTSVEVPNESIPVIPEVQHTDTIPVMKKKQVKDSVRVRYVMAVDTVKTVDSLNINKRKYQKLKDKSK